MAKRYYKIGEMVWVKELKKKGKITALDVPNLKVGLTYFNDERSLVYGEFLFQQIDKLRVKKEIKPIAKPTKKVLYFAKVKPDAVIPSKRKEDAGYDLYANFEGQDIILKKGVPTLVGTGIASSFDPSYYLNCKHERGSTGKVGMSVLSGVVDSGYRGEIFVNLVATHKTIIITKHMTEVIEFENLIYYPYSKAIAQATLDIVPNVTVQEIDYDELLKISSERGTSKLGESGK